MKATDFNLADQNGNSQKLADFNGRWLVLYFYPKDDTPGCTKEACGFRDMSEEFKQRSAAVVGISKDSVASHKKFADKFKLNFTLLSDPTGEVIKSYGSWGKKKFMGKEYEGILRNTYLINPQGEIIKEYKDVNPTEHPEAILKDLAALIK